MKCYSSRGFTLIELMVTLAILIMLMAVAVPGMLDLIRDARLSAQTDLLVSSLNTARLEAIKRRSNMTLCPASDANTATACSTSASDWQNGLLIWDGAAVTQRIQSKTGVVVTPTPSSATTVVFSGTLGSLAAGAVETTFTLCSSGRKQQEVKVGLSGHVSKRTTTTVCS